jgi:hypothetical protein
MHVTASVRHHIRDVCSSSMHHRCCRLQIQSSEPFLFLSLCLYSLRLKAYGANPPPPSLFPTPLPSWALYVSPGNPRPVARSHSHDRVDRALALVVFVVWWRAFRPFTRGPYTHAMWVYTLCGARETSRITSPHQTRLPIFRGFDRHLRLMVGWPGCQ